MLKGKLYMIPTTLGECDVDKILPLYVKEHLHNLDEFIVENSKTARAFLKRMNIPTPQNELKIHVLNKHTPLEEIHSYLNACRNGTNIGLISEAGCPGIADPGSEITNMAHNEDIQACWTIIYLACTNGKWYEWSIFYIYWLFANRKI